MRSVSWSCCLRLREDRRAITRSFPAHRLPVLGFCSLGVGRVGALAFVLGVGAAIAAMPTAVADAVLSGLPV